MLAEQIAGAVAAARSTRTLDDVARVLWRALAEAAVTDADAEALSAAVEARRAILRCPGPARAGRPPAGRIGPGKCHSQRSPDRQRSIERRRRLAASGPLPPALAASFTVGQLAVLRIVGDEVKARGRCTRSMAELAARAGVCRRTARNAIREAQALGLLHVAERRLSAWRNDTNIITVTSAEWSAWLRLGGGGGKKLQCTDTDIHRTSATPGRGSAANGVQWQGWGRRGGGNGPPTPNRTRK